MPDHFTPKGTTPILILKTVVALAFVVSIGPAWAQTQAPAAPRPGERDPHAGERGGRLARALGLTEEQAEQLPTLMGERIGPLMRREMETGEEPDIEGAVAGVADELGLDDSQRERLTQMIQHRFSGEGRDRANSGRGFDFAEREGRSDEPREAMMREFMKRQAKERHEFAERLAARLDLSDDQKARLGDFMNEERERSAQRFSDMRGKRRFGANFSPEGPSPGSSRGDFRQEKRDRREGFRGERRDRRDNFGARDFGSRRQRDEWRGDRWRSDEWRGNRWRGDEWRGDRRRGDARQGRNSGPDCCQSRGRDRKS